MKNLKSTFYKKKILITGHTGFKGSWLTLWLQSLNAQICGVSIDTTTQPSHYSSLKIQNKVENHFFDIKDLKKLKKIFKEFKPDFVFHLAAQSLVRKSYSDPLKTFTTNSIGTLNIMECLKEYKKKCIIVLITSDKSYKNLEIKRGYKEDDMLGGIDPYSASKASAELIIKSYFESFLNKKKNIRLCVARAGNVVGGGDWSENRLIPDCIKSWSRKKTVKIRNPESTRPWQHVLDAVYGYMLLAKELDKNKKLNGNAFNFGPPIKSNYRVIDVLKIMKKNWNDVRWEIQKKKNSHYESNLLKLNSSKAFNLINWKTHLSFLETIKLTIIWYKEFFNNKDIHRLSLSQIDYYIKKN